ncbi:MAG: AAA family ATPase [Bacteroidales bacterium]|nr:AAA family ATPase [Bacteroidales bacterium]
MTDINIFMGTFINRGNAGFQSFRNSEYVDKSMLISVVNRTLFTEFRFTCVSRCRRFGKSMAAKMLAAYYDRSCDSSELFSDLEIANDPSFEKHLNKYPVIYLDMTDYVTGSKKNVVSKIKKDLKADIIDAYPDVALKKNDDLMTVLYRIATSNGEKFIFIIDEWDAICR